MREADQYVQLRENPTSNNVLKLILAMSTENMKFEETEINDIAEQIKDKLKVEHNTVKEFDDDLWRILEKIEINLNWSNVIESYNDKNYKSPNPELIRQTINKMRSELALDLNAEEKHFKFSEPEMFLSVEESFKNNAFIEKLRVQRAQLTKVLWWLYNFSPLKSNNVKKSKYLINWDLAFNLITLTYLKILEKEEAPIVKEIRELKDDSNDLVDIKKFTEVCTGLSTLLFLTPITISNNFNNTITPIINLSEKFLGDNTFTTFLKVLTLGKLENIDSSDEESHNESQWTLTNIIGITGGLLGKFLDRRKFRVLLSAYLNESYETEYSQPSNGSNADFEKLIGALLWHVKPDYISNDHIFKFLYFLNIKGSNLNDVVNRISTLNKDLLDIDSVSLILSSPILYSVVYEYALEDFLEDLLIGKISNTKIAPKRQGVWSANELNDFSVIVYRPAYFKSSRTLIAAISSFYGLENEILSLTIDGAKSIAKEGFIKLSLTFFCYGLLYVFESTKAGYVKKMNHSIHQELFDYLNSFSLNDYLDESDYQILGYCASQENVFGPLFCSVLNSFLDKFNFSNVVDLKVIESAGEATNDEKTSAVDISSFIVEASFESKEAALRIIKLTASIKSNPPAGVWARKLQEIQSDLHTITNEIEAICIENFRDVYNFSLENIPRIGNKFWQNFVYCLDSSKRITLGTICNFFEKLQRINDDRNYSSSSWPDLENHIKNKSIANTLQNISNAEQVLISLDHIRKIRNLISHKSKSRARLEWTQVNFLIQFYRFELKGYIELVKSK